MSIEKTFTDIYQNKSWGLGTVNSPLSGAGSVEELAVPYTNYVKNKINEFKIKSITDFGHGDFNIWVSLVNGLSVLKFDKDFNLQFAIPLTNSGVIDGDYYMKPTVVETDRDNNVWVTYSNQLSSTLSKYTSGGALSLNISIPVSSSPLFYVLSSSSIVH